MKILRKKTLLMSLLTLTFSLGFMQVKADTYYGVNNASDNISINQDASTKNKVAAIPIGASVRLTSINKHGNTGCSSGWYQVYYEEGKLGYVCSKYLNVFSVSSDYSTDANFASQLNSFPDSYKPYIKALHAIYPNARFEAINTNLNWNDAINEESYIGKNLINKSTVGDKTGWINPLAPTQTWDGGTFVAANVDMIKYYMDPRNFLNEKYVFAFEQLSFNNNTHSQSGVDSLISSSFMAAKNIKDDNGNDVSYANTIFNAGKNNSVSPYYLASKIIQEQGSNGVGRSISGTVDGYVGYYNYYDINSYKTNERNSVENGLFYASGSGKNLTTYGRPWNTPYKAINGGAQWIANGYINIGQDTQYSQKFDIIGPDYYQHQYMQNVQGAATEGGRIYNAYTKVNNYKNIQYTFKIPVYNNMPSITYFASIKTGVSTNKGTDNSINNYTDSKVNNNTSSNSSTTNNNSNTSTNIKTTSTITVGDVNSDGAVNSTDLIKVKKHIMGISKLSGNNLKAADTNNDGNVNSTDLIKVKKHILKIINLGKRNV